MQAIKWGKWQAASGKWGNHGLCNLLCNGFLQGTRKTVNLVPSLLLAKLFSLPDSSAVGQSQSQPNRLESFSETTTPFHFWSPTITHPKGFAPFLVGASFIFHWKSKKDSTQPLQFNNGHVRRVKKRREGYTSWSADGQEGRHRLLPVRPPLDSGGVLHQACQHGFLVLLLQEDGFAEGDRQTRTC